MKKLAAIAIAISMLTFSGCATETAKPNSASGESVQAPADMPKVTLDSNGAPVIEKVTSAAPTEFKVAVLTQGSGAIVKKDQQVTVHYTGSVWGGEKFDSSWDRGEPATFPLL